MKSVRSGIYLLTHAATGRRYVGQSKNIDKRWLEHATGKSGSGVLEKAIAKYGWLAFTAEVLELCEKAEMNLAEQKWIEHYGSLSPGGFNLTTGGQKYQFSDDARAVISERTKQALSSPEVRAKISAGVRRAQTPEVQAMIRECAAAGMAAMTPEAVEKMKAKMRIPKSDEWKAKMRGKPKPEEWKALMSKLQGANAVNCERLASLARNQSSETREKIAASKRGKALSPETRARVSAAKIGKKTGPRTWVLTDQSRAKMSASAKARCERQRLEREAGKP